MFTMLQWLGVKPEPTTDEICTCYGFDSLSRVIALFKRLFMFLGSSFVQRTFSNTASE